MKTTTNYFQPKKILLLASLLVMLGGTIPAQENPSLRASFTANANQPMNIDLLVGQSKVIELDADHEAAQVTLPGVVTVSPLTLRTVVINAASVGQVNVHILRKKDSATDVDQMITFNVYVQKNLNQFDSSIKLLYPKENIQLSQINDTVIISGSVTNPEIAENVEKILKSAGTDNKVINLLQKPPALVSQVELQVRIAEVNRSIFKQVGAAYGILNSTLPAYISPGGVAPPGGSITGINSGGTNSLSLSSVANIFLGRGDLTSVVIQALQSRGAIRTLAEPNISAINGKQGKFHSGGKLPIPQIQSAGNGIAGYSVQFQEYGIKLEFTPTIIDENHIQIALNSEVSSIDPNGNAAITTGGVRIPGLRVNSAATMLELADGQSFAIAGLLDNSENVNYSQIPGLGSIPILGQLFTSRSFSRNETELMFLCTVRLKQPLNPDQIPRMPGTPLNNLPAQPNAKSNESSGAALTPFSTAPVPSLNLPTAGLLEGASGHALPPKAEVTVKATPKSDN